jgi:hypothetical protein
MTSEQATLVAAAIAAVASSVTVLLNLLATWGAEARASYRQLLNPKLSQLGEAIHSTIATTNILARANSVDAIERWRSRGATAKAALKELRIDLRYPLWGISEPLRTLSRLPDWIEHARPFPKHSKALVTRARWLGVALDFAVRRSYALGRPPSALERWLARWTAWLVRRQYSKMQAAHPEEDAA